MGTRLRPVNDLSRHGFTSFSFRGIIIIAILISNPEPIMKLLTAFCLGLLPFAALAAPAPNVPPPPSIEGKYTLVSSSTAINGKARAAFGESGPGSGFTSSTVRRDSVITRDSISIDGRTASWDYRLDPSTKPMSIDITITPARGKKTKVLGIVEEKGDKLTIVYAAEGNDRPKDFEGDGENQSTFVFQKVPPPPRPEYKIIVLRGGKEQEVEKELNTLAKDGFEVMSTHATQTPGDPTIHFILKRMVSAK
jgi:uncharacterized protein (TIGR03067 family)